MWPGYPLISPQLPVAGLARDAEANLHLAAEARAADADLGSSGFRITRLKSGANEKMLGADMAIRHHELDIKLGLVSTEL